MGGRDCGIALVGIAGVLWLGVLWLGLRDCFGWECFGWECFGWECGIAPAGLLFVVEGWGTAGLRDWDCASGLLFVVGQGGLRVADCVCVVDCKKKMDSESGLRGIADGQGLWAAK